MCRACSFGVERRVSASAVKAQCRCTVSSLHADVTGLLPHTADADDVTSSTQVPLPVPIAAAPSLPQGPRPLPLPLLPGAPRQSAQPLPLQSPLALRQPLPLAPQEEPTPGPPPIEPPLPVPLRRPPRGVRARGQEQAPAGFVPQKEASNPEPLQIPVAGQQWCPSEPAG